MIPYGKQDVDNQDIEAVRQALKSNLITTGDFVDSFEAALEGVVRTPTFVVSSGTAALHCAYVAIGLKPGDEVITPPNTFIATQATAAMTGATIAFADIEATTGLISLQEIEKRISERTKAIVVVDYAGQTIDLDSLREIIGDRNIIVVQDAAHSFGTTYKNRPIGSIADITSFSFFPTKNLTTGEGGAVASSNPEYFSRGKKFGRQGLVRNPSEFLLDPSGPWHQEVQEFGLNYRLTDFQCALGLSQLTRLHHFKEKRKHIFFRYRENLKSLDRVRMLEINSDCDTMWHLFPVRVPKESRRDLFIFLREKGIGVQVNYFPAHCHPVFSRMGHKPTDFPESMKFYEEEISLPMHVGVTDHQIDYISELIQTFLRK